MVDLSLLVDGLRAEREQGITIDVAYRYFATARRTFIIADTPGHVQYTRNMVTGASTADLAVILVDARKGVLEQSKRHAYISSLLGIPHMAVAVNKMDLVDFSEEVFDAIVREFSEFARGLAACATSPTCRSRAKHGDNVVDRSERMPWYGGVPLLEHLESVHVADDRNLDDVRFPVQWVIRDHDTDYRGYAGQVAGGVLRPGDEVQVLPSGARTRIATHRHVRRPGRRGVRADVRDAPARGRDRHLARRPHLRGRRRAVARARGRGDGLLDDRRAAARRREVRDQARDARRARGRSTRSSTASTSTRSSPTAAPTSSRSTTSAACGCAPPSRSRSTPTRATAPPARSSSSTRPRTTPSARA